MDFRRLNVEEEKQMRSYNLFFSLSVILLVGCTKDEAPTLKVGHVGHDHQAALYIACLEGERVG